MPVNPKTTTRTGGRQTVGYRNVNGQVQDAVVTGGTGTSLNLHIAGGSGTTRRLTAVPKATGMKQTNVWFYR